MSKGNKKETLLVALGGNALIRKGQESTIIESTLDTALKDLKQVAKYPNSRILTRSQQHPSLSHWLESVPNCRYRGLLLAFSTIRDVGFKAIFQQSLFIFYQMPHIIMAALGSNPHNHLPCKRLLLNNVSRLQMGMHL